MDKSISVFGCGWLGLPMAVKLLANGWQVKGSTTTETKLTVLAKQGIEPYLVHLANITAADKNFFESEVLLINIPPGLRKQRGSDYLAQMEQLLQVVALSPVKYVVFISSTSVYPELNKVISDVNEADPDNVLYQSEQLFAECPQFKTTIIRFAGLIGPGRPPARFFAGRQNIPNGQAPVNLIHLDDCIGIVEAVLKQEKFDGVYHAAAPNHPAKQDFYTEAAKHAGLPLPGFVDELLEWKVIESGKIIEELGYNISPFSPLQK